MMTTSWRQFVDLCRFRRSTKNLTNAEYALFLIAISSKFDRDRICDLLAGQGCTFNDNHSLIKQFNQIISNIIINRSKHNQNVANVINTNHKIDNLPSQIIGEIGSFLHQRDYALFSRCNRSILISLNSPITLQSITTHINTRVALQNYPHIKSLSLSTSGYSSWTSANHTICNKLENLSLDIECKASLSKFQRPATDQNVPY